VVVLPAATPVRYGPSSTPDLIVAAVIFLVFLAGGTCGRGPDGRFAPGVNWLLEKFRNEAVVIPLFRLLSATMGALENMREEIVPLNSRYIQFDAPHWLPTVTAAAVNIGSGGGWARRLIAQAHWVVARN
jgi:uncharacterized ion transporter superfamily protein YfcC